MANDITTLAIEIQSQEAERNLRTFNELLSLSSQTANKMGKMSIEIDVQGALEQLRALKTGYDEIAASAQNIHFDAGATGTPNVEAPQFDAEALNSLKEFFRSSAEMSKAFREEMERFNETLKEIEANSTKVSSAGGRTSGTSRNTAAAREYAAALKELIAAEKELEKAVAKADADGQAAYEADTRATAAKKQLTAAQRELKNVTDQLRATHAGQSGDIIGLEEKEDMLKAKILELKEAYAKAKAEADKFGAKLDESASKADAASAKYREAKERVESIPKDPMGAASKSTETFAEKARTAGHQATSLARGINGIASMAGAAIPGISGLGRAISMIGMSNPYLAAAAIAIGAISAAVNLYNNVMEGSLEITQKVAESHARSAEIFKKEAEERQEGLGRLAVLNSYEKLYDVEKEESRKIVEKLTKAYKGLGIQYDSVTGKVANLAEVQKTASEQDTEALKRRLASSLKLAKAQVKDAFEVGRSRSDAWITDFPFEVVASDIPGTNGHAGTFFDRLWDYIKAGGDLEEQLLRINEVEANLASNFGPWEKWALGTKDMVEYLGKYRSAIEKQQKAQAAFDASGQSGRSDAEIAKSIRAREAKLAQARAASMSEDDKYLDTSAAISALEAKKDEFSKKSQRDIVVYKGQQITAEEALLDIEDEITNRTRERLGYEKQLKALAEKIEAQKKDWNFDDSGINIIGKKDNTTKQAERNSKIDTFQAQIRELQDDIAKRGEGDAYSKVLQKQKDELQLKLNALQQEKINYEESEKKSREAAAEAAKKHLEEARKSYVLDSEGNLVRKKHSDELAASLAAEVAEAKKRVEAARIKAATQATNEQAADSAEKELTALRQQEKDLLDQKLQYEKAHPGESGESDDVLADLESQIAALKERIEAAKKKAEEARKKAGATGASADLSKEETTLAQLQARQLAEKEATEAAKQRAEEAKRGLVFDQNGNILREKTHAELAAELQAEIAVQRAKVAQLQQGSKDRYEAEAKLTALLRKEYDAQKQEQEKNKREQKSYQDAHKRAEDAKKGYVWDANGNVLRRKTEQELQKEREKEIAAAKAKVASTKAGTKEREDALAELRRLQVEDFNAKNPKGGSSAGKDLIDEEQKVHSNMVKGVDARSTEAMALQARNFTRGSDPEKKTESALKEITKIGKDIRDNTNDCADYLDVIQTDTNDLINMVVSI